MTAFVGAWIVYDNKLLFIKHNRKQMWLPVGGHIENGETIYDAVLREVKEETNLDVQIISYNPQYTLPDYLPVPFVIMNGKETGYEFIAKTSSLESLSLQTEEVSDYILLSPFELKTHPELSPSLKKKGLFVFDFLGL